MPTSARPRANRPNSALVRCVVGYFFACITEWVTAIAVLQFVLERDGTRAAGFAALTLTVPNVVFAPFSASLERRFAANRLLQVTYAVQLLLYLSAGIAATTGLSSAAVVVPSSLALAALAVVRPTTAAISPVLATTPRELSQANLWLGAAENASGLVGPLLAGALILLHGPGLAICACAALLFGSLLTFELSNGPITRSKTGRQPRRRSGSASGAAEILHADTSATTPMQDVGAVEAAPIATASIPLGEGHAPLPSLGPWQLVREGIAALRTRPGAAGVLLVAGGHALLIGALDLLYVVLARDELNLGGSGPGWLATCFGVGAVASSLLGSRLVARERLGPLLAGGLCAIGVAALAIGAEPTVVVVVIMLVTMGFSRSLVKLMSRMLLQRAVLPEHTASVFAATEVLAGVALLAGTLLTQTLIEIGGVRLAFVGIGACFFVMLVGVATSLRVADRHADVPVVAISLLRQVPVFAPLLPDAIERVARSANEVRAHMGDVIIREGDRNGDSFYVVGDGAFEVRMEGRHIRTARRGDSFGEVALLADVPRTATITAATDGLLLAIDRDSFLRAVAGNEFARRRLWSVVEQMELPAHVSVTRGENG